MISKKQVRENLNVHVYLKKKKNNRILIMQTKSLYFHLSTAKHAQILAVHMFY